MEKNTVETAENISRERKFQEDKKDLSLKYRESKNQRIIDVQKSLKTHQIIPYEV